MVFERLGASDRDEGRQAVGRHQIEVGHQRDHRLRAGQPAHAPASHAVAFRHGIDDQRTLGHAGQRARREVLAAAERPVDLVRQQPEIVLLADFGQLLEPFARVDSAGRVVRRIDQDGARVGLQRRADHVGARLEAVLGRRFNHGEAGAGGAERVGVGGVVGRDDDGVIARVEHALHGGVKRGLAARRGDDLVRFRRDARASSGGRRHGLAQARQARKRRIVVVAGADGVDAGLDRFGRRIEVMIADREHDDVLAGGPAAPGGEVDFPAILAQRHDAGNAL